MRSNKHYTNVTFTRRVDHEAGKHRPPRAGGEPRVCITCGALYRKRRWISAELAAKEQAPSPWVRERFDIVRCPACRRVANTVPSGIVHLDGAFLGQHRPEIVRLVQREATRAAEDNPLGRIIGWDLDPHHRLIVKTTTEHLAQRLGHALKKAFKGKVRYDFSHENKMAHVYWSRD